MLTVIGVGLGSLLPVISDALTPFSDVRLRLEGDRTASIDGSAPAIVMFGPDADEPAEVARRLSATGPIEALIVLSPESTRRDVHSTLLVSPFVPPRTVVMSADEDVEDLGNEVQNLVAQVLRTIEHRTILDSVNQAIAGRKPGAPPAATYLDALMRQAPIGVLLVDRKDHVLEANPASHRLLETSQAAIVGAHVTDLLGPRTDGAPEGTEYRYTVSRRCPGGNEQVLEVTFAPVDEDPVAGLVLIHDVTTETLMERERRRAEQDLLFQKSLLEAQSEAAVEGILVVDQAGKILSHNRRFVEMWQIPSDVVESRSDDAAIDAVTRMVLDPEGFVERIRYLYAHPRETSREEIPLRDGRIFDRYSAPVIGGDDKVQGRVWFFNDVTEQRRNEAALRFAADSADILADTLDARVTLARIARLAVPRLGDWCVIYRQDADGTIERIAMEFSDPADVVFAREMEQFPLNPEATAGVSDVIRSGRSLLHADVTPETLSTDVIDTQAFAEIVRRVGVTSWICVPLEARGRVLGAMSFISSHSGRRYDEHDLALAEDLGHRAGLAMENAALFEHQRYIARTLQQSLLPRRMPDVDGLDVAVRYIAAGEGYDVGGDFYDLFSTSDDTWGVVIGDVVGKGPDAAALTALARYTVRTAAMQDPSPESVLSVLNEAIERQHDGARFCTAVYARMRSVDGGYEVSIARGGHPPPLVLRANGTVDEFTPNGYLLGVFPEANLECAETRLRPGDSLVLYTDGVTEARSGPVTLGEDGLAMLLGKCRGMDADRCADEIERAVLDLQEGRAHDDVALVVLRVDGPAEAEEPVTRPAESMWFPARPEALRDVRVFVRRLVEGVASIDTTETAILLADELAANAVRHARTDFRVAVAWIGDLLRIEVRDLSPQPPEMLPLDPQAPNGRGLPILASESSRWGVSHRADGKAVWFELDVPGEQARDS